jgi:hypothetical protein
MPAVGPTLEYIQTSRLNTAELRGVDATALRTGDLAFLTSTLVYYYLDKASFAPDDGVNVIATKGAITVPFPLGDPAIPGRWILGPCVGCGTNAQGMDENPDFVEVTEDSFTNSVVMVNLLTINFVAPGGTALEIQADASGDNTASGEDAGSGGARFQLFLDALPVPGGTSSAAFTVSAAGRIMSAQITKKTGAISAGAHVLELRWLTVGNGTAQIFPATRPRSDHASLFARQVNV